MRLSHRLPAFSAAVFATLAAPHAHAVVIRGYDFTRDTRLAWMPDQHLENSGFGIPQDKLRGIGWPVQFSGEWHRQMAMISPIHFVFANHYDISTIPALSFQLPDGTLLNRNIASAVTVKNASGLNTDLLFGTLESPIDPQTGIAFFPVANLGADANYLGKRGWAFGKVAIAGRATFSGFGTLTDDGFNHTRYIYFDYSNASGAADDCYFESGDSGSPTLIVENGQPALVGTHSYEIGIAAGHRSYDTFIPDYLTQLDALMEPQGYHVKRLYPAATLLTATASAVASLQPGQAGTASIVVDNTGSADAHNLTLSLSLSRPASTVSGSGWICTQTGESTWLCRRGGAVHGAAAPALSASWTDAGETGTIKINGSLFWDGAAAPVALASSLAVGSQAYADWTGSVIASGVGEDPDHDGVRNLLEYAFGGDPTVTSTAAIGGYPLLPVITPGMMTYAKRSDAAQRGLVYHLENSADLINWTEELPPGVSSAETAFSPPVSGFVRTVVTLPAEAHRYFRLRVELTP